MKNKRRYLLVLAVLLALAALLTGCACEHEWQDSTCQAPRTCVRCGATEGKVRAHTWGSTACEAPVGCTVCGTMEGIELTHTWCAESKICIHCAFDGRPADDRFMDKLAEGINTRWSLFWYEDETLTKEDWRACIQAEYDLLIPFLEEKFQDETLEEAAKAYIRVVAASMEAVESFDPATWGRVYDAALFQEQCVALYKINLLRPVNVSQNHAPRFAYTLEQGEVINMIYPFFDEILFLCLDGSRETKTYETTLENTTTLHFKRFTFEVDLCDANGDAMQVVESTVYSWTPGEKIRFNFKTNLNFETMKVRFADWDF